ncbi:hypothetical protein PG995_012991 [Apiospora arundinis]
MLLIAIVNIVTIRSNGDAQGGANEQINVAVLSQHLVDGSEVEPGSPARRSWPGLREGAGHGRGRSSCQGSHATDNTGVSGKNASDGSGDNQ